MQSGRNFSARRIRKVLVGLLLIAVGCNAAAAAEVSPASSSRATVALGQKLFFDPHLSRDGTISCSSCHQPTHAFSDGRTVSIGIDKLTGTRNAPSLLGLFDGEPLFWDGRRDKLQIAVLDPIGNPVEMAQADLSKVTRRLSERADYAQPIALAFPGTTQLTSAQLGEALAAFIRTLPQQRSAYDRYAKGQKDALTPDAVMGLQLFEGKAGCSGCHLVADGHFTDEKFHHSGVGLQAYDAHLGELTTQALQRNLQGSALGNAVAQHADQSALGRFMVSHQAADVGAFRTPSLRDVALTAPYMHDGSVKTLAEAVDTEVYYRGLSTGKPVSLSIQERQYLIAFLHSLTTTH